MNLNDYKYVDLILGKECQTKMGGGGVKPLEFKTFSQPMQEAITAYCGQGRKHLRLGCLCRNRPLGQSALPRLRSPIRNLQQKS